jgi:hypothetical protein
LFGLPVVLSPDIPIHFTYAGCIIKKSVLSH